MKLFGDTGPLGLDDLRFGRTSKVTPHGYRSLMGRQPGECTWCGGPVPKGARSWCGPGCVEEWTIRNQPAVAREKVLARDGGVCASCGADCLERTRRIEHAIAAIRADFDRKSNERIQAARALEAAGEKADWSDCRVANWRETADAGLIDTLRAAIIDGTGVAPRLANVRRSDLDYVRIPPTWEADHVVPVVEGGGFCGLDGYRTLCVFCHRAETAALATRRTQARREQPADIGQVALFGGDP